MDEHSLRQLISGGETGTVEFKIKAPRPAELAERMCGMANTRTGGVIIFGVADESGELVGLTKPNEAIDLILRAARIVKPPLQIGGESLTTHMLDGRTVIIAQVPSNNGTLYQASGVFWIRRGSHTVPLSVDEISTHLYSSGALQWETEVCRRASLDDLDDTRVEQYLAFRTARSRQNLRHTSREELLVGLSCAAPEPQSDLLRPTNVGMLMFGYDPQWHIPQSEVVCVRYADDIGVRRYADRQIITGTALEVIDATERYLANVIAVSGEIIGFKRVDKPEYPIEALREAVVNAVVHRDYSREGEAIRVFMYSDRIEVHSPGLLPPGISLDDLKTLRAPSRPRNALLAQFLRDIPGYAERIGAGIRLMVNEMALLGLPKPEFLEQHEFVVIFRNGRVGTSQQTSALSARQLLGLRLIQERGSITTREYVEMTGASERTALRELRDMVDRGVIVVRGRTRSARYYLP
jgi:ATP-dependent DNA helicase RecG